MTSIEDVDDTIPDIESSRQRVNNLLENQKNNTHSTQIGIQLTWNIEKYKP